jgi:serine/threonine protein kinase
MRKLCLFFAISLSGCREGAPAGGVIETSTEEERVEELEGGKVIADPSTVKAFDEGVEICKAQMTQVIEDNCETQLGEIQLENGDVVTVGKRIGGGDFGDTFLDSRSEKYVVKVSKPNKEAVEDICKERVLLGSLHGLKGGIPRMHALKQHGQGSNRCLNQILVMDKLGDADWGRVTRSTPDAWLYRRLARLLDIVRSLHEKGFVHFDIKGDNVRVNSQSSEAAFLIDFGIAFAFADETGKHKFFLGRKADLESIVDMISTISFGKNSWFDDFKREVESLEPKARPNYEKWINCLNKLASYRLRDRNNCSN